MRGILILCGGSGAGRRGYGQRRERGWPEGVRPTRGGRRKRRRRRGADCGRERQARAGHKNAAAGGCAGRSGVREGRRDAGTPGHRRGPGGASGRRGGGRKGSVAGCGQCRKAGIRAAAGAWVTGGSAADQRGAKKEAAEAWRGLRKGTAGVSGAQERGGRRECGRPEGVGKRESERGQGRRGPGGGPQQVNRRSPWGRRWRSRS